MYDPFTLLRNKRIVHVELALRGKPALRLDKSSSEDQVTNCLRCRLQEYSIQPIAQSWRTLVHTGAPANHIAGNIPHEFIIWKQHFQLNNWKVIRWGNWSCCKEWHFISYVRILECSLAKCPQKPNRQHQLSSATMHALEPKFWAKRFCTIFHLLLFQCSNKKDLATQSLCVLVSGFQGTGKDDGAGEELALKHVVDSRRGLWLCCELIWWYFLFEGEHTGFWSTGPALALCCIPSSMLLSSFPL